ncbi:alpha/beta fold hydrolase [Comamonas composti]|uniref:alpha/beta fold hydrolase n=1 Tax=Comamonas composti TaxID=408558 RepID=UPI0003FA55BD|nr:alpha/beta fold hydrolase [Comamonas composti]
MNHGDDVDVLIVGAGLSGIGLACYLQKLQPAKSFALLEARSATGGTWDLFRYPGIRSDSDLHTFGYEFKPWQHKKAIADGQAILDYLRETVAEHDLTSHIRLNHKVVQAQFDSREGLWQVTVLRTDTQQRLEMRCRWLFCAAGYYRYEQGHTPEFEGIGDFGGQVIHPQHWPQELDYAGRNIVVIGSGATAVTLVPALAQQAGHVTMLQRTPTYVMAIPSEDRIANWLKRWLPARTAHALTRSKNLAISRMIWNYCRKHPDKARARIRKFNLKALPPGYPVDEHFNPPYQPWDQRLCAVPDGDLFEAIASGKASVVTDHIERITPGGVRLRSGRFLEADIIVTATGLDLQQCGGMQLLVDGRPVDLSQSVAFKGMMLSGLPNFCTIVGYTNASWTLKVGLLCEHFCRLLAHMDEQGHQVCMPVLKNPEMPTRPLLDFGAGYVQRALSSMPRQGLEWPWLMSMDYREDVKVLRRGPVEDECLQFSSAVASTSGHGGCAPSWAVDSTEQEAGEDCFCELASGVRLCYRVTGPPDGAPLILIAGLGMQLTSWPPSLIAGLAERGYRVITLDNRDIGRSSRAAHPPAGRMTLMLRRPRTQAYTLEDMAGDVLGLMQHLQVEAAHVAGMSMGGMIAQAMASMAGPQVLSLISIFSTTGASSVGQPAVSTLRLLFRKPPQNRAEAAERLVALFRHIGPKSFDLHEAELRKEAGQAWDRGDGAQAHRGVRRQMEAIMKSGDRTRALHGVRAPTLVIHGDTDLLVHPSGGLATARAIAGAVLVQLHDMGHFIPRALVPTLADLIDGHAQRAGHAAASEPAARAQAHPLTSHRQECRHEELS